MAGSSDTATHKHASNSASTAGDSGEVVVSALFSNNSAAHAAIRELRDIGIPADSISLISRDQATTPQSDMAGVPGVAREEVVEEGLTYRASTELPNDEDLPTTEAAMTGGDMPPTLGDDRASDAGDERIGLSRDTDMVRRNEAQTNADEDIYSDFKDAPGGVNPDSPAALRAASDVQAPSEGRANPGGNSVAGIGVGGFVGLLAGLGALAIPGVGPVIAAGPLAAVLGSIAAGGAAGGIIGALSGIGVPESYAREYASAIEGGQTLVSVRTNTLLRDPVERALTANGGETIH